MNRKLRQLLMKNQDDRNKRLRRPRGKQRRTFREKAKSLFLCSVCGAKVVIAWKNLGDSKLLCKCGGNLVLHTACLNKGVLPRA